MHRILSRSRRGAAGGILVCCFALLAGARPLAPANAQCLDCKQLGALRTALTVVNLPEKWLSDERLQAAAELFGPFEGAMEPAALVSMLLYLKADPRDFSVQQAQFALDFIHGKAVEFSRSPPPEAGAASLWAAIGINSAARGDDLVLLQQRFAEAGFPAEQIPADLFFAVAERGAAAAADSAQVLVSFGEGASNEENPRDAAENAKNAASLAKTAKTLADQAAAAKELSDLAALLQAAMPGKSRRPWDQLESNTKALLSGTTANLSLLTGVLALKGNKGIQGGLAGLLAQTADALTLQQVGPDGQPVAVPALGSLSEVLKYIGAAQAEKVAAATKAAARGRFDGVAAAVGSQATRALPRAELARLLGLPTVRPVCIDSFSEDDPVALDRLNQYLLGRRAEGRVAEPISFLDGQVAVSKVICVVSATPDATGECRLLVDSGLLEFCAVQRDAIQVASQSGSPGGQGGPAGVTAAGAQGMGAPEGSANLTRESILALENLLEGFAQ